MKLLKLLCLVVLGLISNCVWANGLQFFEDNDFQINFSNTEYNAVMIPIINTNEHLTAENLTLSCVDNTNSDTNCSMEQVYFMYPQQVFFAYLYLTNSENYLNSEQSITVKAEYTLNGILQNKSIDYNLYPASNNNAPYMPSIIINGNNGDRKYFMDCNIGIDFSANIYNFYSSTINNDNIQILGTSDQWTGNNNFCVPMKVTIGDDINAVLTVDYTNPDATTAANIEITPN